MLSRVADSLYWLGRYIERAENYARFIEVNFNLSLDLPPGVKEQWEPLIAITGDKELFDKKHRSYSRQNVIHFMAFERDNFNSIARSVEFARENARIVRENISREAWETLNSLHHYIQNAYKRAVWVKDDPRDVLQRIKDKIHVLYGLAYDMELRGEGWYFNKMGQYVERADKSARILDVKYHVLLPSIHEVGTPLDYLHWAALLKSVGGFNAYKRRYGKISPEMVLEYMILSKYFPRSIFYCLESAENCLHNITGSPRGYSNPAEKAIGALRSELEFTDCQSIIQEGPHEYLEELQEKLAVVSDKITEQFFTIKPNFVTDSTSEA